MDALLDVLQRGLGDSFRIERELGGGGMSRVFLARETSLGRPVVLKVLSAEASEGASADRFRREIQLIAKLRHPHVVPILAASQVDGMLYYVMPFIAGDSLRAHLSRHGALGVREAVHILREVVGALGFAHRHGVVHRDIKPENILLEAGHALVADFGVSKALRESARLTSTGISLGTLGYMAPEQSAGDPALDHRADIYAVGVVAYEMLTGAPPFSGTPVQVVTAHMMTPAEPIRNRRSDVPPALADLIMRALEKDPSNRPQGADDMVAVLDSITFGDSATSMPESIAAPRSSPILKRRRTLAVAVAAVALIAFGGWRLARPAVAGSARSIAIIPFSVADGDTALVRLSQNLVTLVSNNLDGVGEIRMADPIAVLSHARSVGHVVESPDAIGIARALGTKRAVYGTLVRTGATVRIDAGLYDVSAPDAPLGRVSVSAPPDSVEALTDSLTMALLRQVWSKGAAPTPHVTSITTHSPVAMREFLDGERQFMHGNVHTAGDAYKRAVDADTTFWFAAYRYGLARSWLSERLEDSSIVQRLDRHRADLPERERALLAVNDSSPTQSELLRRLAALAERYPDYAPAWEQMADLLTHHFIRSGHSVADAVEPWRRVAALMPSDLATADHLVHACIGAGDLACASQSFTRFDSLVRADPAAAKDEVAEQRLLTLALEPPTRARRDSIIGVAMRDSAIWGSSPAGVMQFAPLLVDRPEAFSGMDEVNQKILAIPALAPSFQRLIQCADLLARATRGDWAALDSADAVVAAGPIAPGLSVSRVDMLRSRVLGELQAAIPPSAKTLDAIGARIDDASLTPPERTEMRWLLGVSALVRHDSTTVRAQMTALAKDTLAVARIATRSLRALDLGLSGKRPAAAESLLALERVHGERAPKVWGAFAADRLLGAQWLTEAGKPAPADSLLEFTRGYVFGPYAQVAWPVFAAAQLQRSRIAEVMGRRDEAIRFSTIFLRVYDLAPADHRSQRQEATQRIERLGGTRDNKAPQKLP